MSRLNMIMNNKKRMFPSCSIAIKASNNYITEIGTINDYKNKRNYLNPERAYLLYVSTSILGENELLYSINKVTRIGCGIMNETSKYKFRCYDKNKEYAFRMCLIYNYGKENEITIYSNTIVGSYNNLKG